MWNFDQSIPGFSRLTSIGRTRKIRCVFRLDRPNVCCECFARGGECVNQGDAETVSFKQKKNVRERLTLLENMLASMREELDEHKKLLRTHGNGNLKDNLVGINWPVAASSLFDIDVPSPSLLHIEATSRITKNEKARQSLASILPTGEALLRLWRNNDIVWLGIQKTKRITKSRYATLEQFATYAFREGSSHDLAEVAHVLAPVLKGPLFDQLLHFVDQFIISDDEHLLSVDGLQCAVLQGLYYSNSGNAARAWQTWRRAISFAQLLGLHKTRESSEAEMAWWALYSLDRFFSLNLGVPSAIADEHCNMVYQGQHINKVATSEGFMLRLSHITGKVISHLEGNFSWSLEELGNELTRLAAEMPPDFWVSGPLQTTMDWQLRIISHLTFYRIEFALYLPYLQAATNPLLAPQCERCIRASRKFLQTYIIFRHPSNKFAEICRVYDSVACAATIVLLLCSWRFRKSDIETLPATGDLELIRSSMELLRCISDRPGESFAVQGYRALQQVTQSQSMSLDVIENSAKTFQIPLLGKFFFSWSDTFSVRAARVSISLENFITPPASYEGFPWDSDTSAAPVDLLRPIVQPDRTTMISNNPQPTFDWNPSEFDSLNSESLFFQEENLGQIGIGTIL
jgi:hypothetical protein